MSEDETVALVKESLRPFLRRLYTARDAADAVTGALVSLGWRPPARVLDTDTQVLADVASGSVVRDASGRGMTLVVDRGAGVVSSADGGPGPSFPVTLLWEP